MTNALSTLLEVEFNDDALLINALTHKSHPDVKDYERLEFLGDRVLNLSVAAMLLKHFPHYTEGQLAKHHAALVRSKTLAEIAALWQLQDHIRVGKSAQSSSGLQTSILADVVEAILGAIFLEHDFNTAANIVIKFWTPLINSVDVIDAKSALQEFLQAAGHALPTYKTTSSEGKDHNKTFTLTVSSALGEASGTGTSKQKAAQVAAQNLLHQIKQDAK